MGQPWLPISKPRSPVTVSFPLPLLRKGEVLMQRHERLIAFTAALLAFAPIVGGHSAADPDATSHHCRCGRPGRSSCGLRARLHNRRSGGRPHCPLVRLRHKVDRLVPSAPGFQFLSDVSGGRVAHTIASATGNRISVADVAGNTWTEISGPRSLGLQSRETWWRSRT